MSRFQGIVSAMECATHMSLQQKACCRKFGELCMTQDTACDWGHMLPGQPLVEHTVYKGLPLPPDMGLFCKQPLFQSSPLGWLRLPQCSSTGRSSFYPILLSSPFPFTDVEPVAWFEGSSLTLPAPSPLYPPHKHHPQWIPCTSNSVSGFCLSEPATNTALSYVSLGWKGVVCFSSLMVTVGGGTEMIVRAGGQERLRTGRLKGTVT